MRVACHLQPGSGPRAQAHTALGCHLGPEHRGWGRLAGPIELAASHSSRCCSETCSKRLLRLCLLLAEKGPPPPAYIPISCGKPAAHASGSEPFSLLKERCLQAGGTRAQGAVR